MKKEIKVFLEHIVENLGKPSVSIHTIVDEAIELLKEDLKEEVINKFGYFLNEKELKEAILKKDKVDFICYTVYRGSLKNFIKENWDRLDEIIDILKEHLEEHSEDYKEEKKEEKENND